MAQPIALEIPPRNPRAELRSRLEEAPEEHAEAVLAAYEVLQDCLLYTSPSPRDLSTARMPSSA